MDANPSFGSYTNQFVPISSTVCPTMAGYIPPIDVRLLTHPASMFAATDIRGRDDFITRQTY